MKFFLIIILALFFSNCKEKDANLENKNIKNLEFIDVKIDEDCNFYLLFFREGSIIGKINTSGYCKKLTSEIYYKAYEKLLQNNISEIPLKSGKLIFEYESNDNDSLFMTKLNEMSKKYFKSKSKIISITESELTLEIE